MSDQPTGASMRMSPSGNATALIQADEPDNVGEYLAGP